VAKFVGVDHLRHTKPIGALMLPGDAASLGCRYAALADSRRLIIEDLLDFAIHDLNHLGADCVGHSSASRSGAMSLLTGKRAEATLV
jgi:hypothetical protein